MAPASSWCRTFAHDYVSAPPPTVRLLAITVWLVLSKIAVPALLQERRQSPDFQRYLADNKSQAAIDAERRRLAKHYARK